MQRVTFNVSQSLTRGDALCPDLHTKLMVLYCTTLYCTPHLSKCGPWSPCVACIVKKKSCCHFPRSEIFWGSKSRRRPPPPFQFSTSLESTKGNDEPSLAKIMQFLLLAFANHVAWRAVHNFTMHQAHRQSLLIAWSPPCSCAHTTANKS